MKTQFILTASIILLLIGCKNETKETPVPATREIVPEATKTECYTYEANGNKIDMKLERNEAGVTGTLTYHLAEKDSNTGTFAGKIENNILIAEYIFQSEGIESTRQVAFKLAGDKLIEGYGEMTLDGTHFKDVSQIQFNGTMPLKKVECPK